MAIYSINLIFVVAAVSISRRIQSVGMSRICLGIAFASMVLVAGLRDRLVGTDTPAYVTYYSQIRAVADVSKIGSQVGEYGFWMLTWIPHYISEQYAIYLFFIALVVVGFYFRAILAYSENSGVSFFVFITMGFYLFFFNGARQGIACAIFALAFGPLLERKVVRYTCYVLLAFLFHKSAIVLLPIYFLFGRPYSLRSNIIILITGVLVAYFYQEIVMFGSDVDAHYGGYGAANEGGGYFIVAFHCALYLFFVGFKQYVQVDAERYDLYLRLFLLGTMIGIVSSLLSVNPSGFLRLSMYFTVSAVFIWPIIFNNLTDRWRIPVKYCFAAGYLTYFALTTERFSNLVPYVINPIFAFK